MRVLPVVAVLIAAGLAVAAGGGATWPARGAVVGLSAALAVVALVAWRSGSITPRRVIVTGLAMRLMFLPLPPGLSDDLWRYLWDGLAQANGLNPYLHRPIDSPLAGAWAGLLPRMNSPEFHSVYPPLSQAFFLVGGLAARATGSAWAGYYGVKLPIALCEAIALLLLARSVSGGACPARRSPLALYAWNPLVLLECAGQGHSEAVMLPLLVGTILAARHDRWRLAGVLLAGATMVKLYPALLLPLLWRRGGWRSVWPSLAAMALLALPYAHPAVPGNVGESVRLYSGHFEFNNVPYFVLRDLVNGLDPSPANVGREHVGRWLRLALLVGVAAVYVVDWRTKPRLDRAFSWVLAGFVATTTTVHPWYALALVSLPWNLGRPSWAWLWFGVASVGTYLRYAPNGEAAYLAACWVAWGGLIGIGFVSTARNLYDRLATGPALRR